MLRSAPPRPPRRDTALAYVTEGLGQVVPWIMPVKAKMIATSLQATVKMCALALEAEYHREEQFQVVQAVRALMKKCVKPLTEEVKYGGILFASDVRFGGVFAYKEHVSVEFSRGAKITDREGHLEGGGKGRRHIKLRAVSDIAAKRLATYVALALAAARGDA